MKIQKLFEPVAAECDPAMIFVSIELSRKSWVIGMHTPLAESIGLHTLNAGDSAGLLELIRRTAGKVERMVGGSVRVVSCYEAGYDGFWLHRVLAAASVGNHVIDPASLQVNRRARRAKTDRIDARAMVRALMAYVRGEDQVFSVVRVPVPEDEDAKRTFRERQRLITERVGHVNRIKGLLATQGIYDFEPLKGDPFSRLASLRTAPGAPLAPRLASELRRELRRLSLVRELLAEVEAERNAVIATDGPQGERADKLRQLIRLRGIGPEIATGLVNEVFYRDFENRRKLAGFVGLSPSPFASGATVRDQGISKAGPPRVRTLTVELAWQWLRYQPDSALSRWFQARVNGLKGRIKRIAIVALARKLLVALWRYLDTGLVPDGAIVKP
jgi:transposase